MEKILKLIEWEDAFGCSGGWQHQDELETGTSIVRSVGFVVEETAESITLAPHIGGWNREQQQFAGVITIPRRQIILISSCQVLE